MANISVLSRLVNGLNRNVDLSSNTIVVGNIKVGGATNYATFNISAVSGEKTITMPNANVNLGDIATNASSISTHLNGGASKHDATEVDYERADGSKKNIQAASDEVEAALTDLDDAIGSMSQGSNYTAASIGIVASHLAAIDTALASAGGVDFSDATFRISDNTTPTKKIAFEASGITASTIRTITMPDTNVDLGDIATNSSHSSGDGSDHQDVADLVTLSGVAANSVNLGAFSGSAIPDSQTIKQALQAVETYIENSRSIIQNFEWYNLSALDYVVNNTLVPASENSGDVYVLSHDGGTPHANFDGAAAGDIVQFDGSSWVKTTPTTGMMISVDDETSSLRQWSGSAWSQKFFESTTASTGLVKSGFDIRLADASASNGVSVASGAISAVFDDSSIGINGSEQLYVKASGITNDMLAGSIADSKLASDYIQTSEVDGSSIEFGSSLNVKALGITNAMLAGSIATSKLADSAAIAEAVTFFGATDLSGAEAETLSDGSNADALHKHGIVKKSFVAGEAFAANTVFAVRLAVNGENGAQSVNKADKDASSSDKFHVIGIVYSTSSVAQGESIDVIMLGEIKSSVAFTASQDEGKAVFLSSAGAITLTPPSTVDEAVVKVGNVMNVGVAGTASILVNAIQVMGVN